MKHDVLIRLTASQQTDEDGAEKLEMTTKGTLEKTADGYVVEYDEPDEEMKDCRTSVLVNSPGVITMTRAGGFSTQLVIERNKRHNCHYETPFGGMMVGVFASEVKAKLSPDGGLIRMHYTIDLDSNMISENKIRMEISKI